MSLELYKADNLTITIAKWEYIDASCTEDNVYKENTTNTIRVHISILINGKIKTIFQEYEVENWLLNDYTKPWVLSDILNSLWYEIVWIYNMLEKWIRKLFPNNSIEEPKD